MRLTHAQAHRGCGRGSADGRGSDDLHRMTLLRRISPYVWRPWVIRTTEAAVSRFLHSWITKWIPLVSVRPHRLDDPLTTPTPTCATKGDELAMTNAKPPGLIGRLLRQRKSAARSSAPRPRRNALIALAALAAVSGGRRPDRLGGRLFGSHRQSGIGRPRNQAGQDQARLADHPGEQVLRRDVHRAEQQHLPVADAAGAGRAAEELLRHRALQPRQLHLDGQRPGHAARHAGRLPVLRPVLGHASTRRARCRPTRTTARSPPPRARTRRPAPTAACTRRACRRCSTSSMRRM